MKLKVQPSVAQMQMEGAACPWGILTYPLARRLDIAATLNLSQRERPFYWLLPSSCDEILDRRVTPITADRLTAAFHVA